MPPGGQEQPDPPVLKAVEGIQHGGSNPVGLKADQGPVNIEKDRFYHLYISLSVIPSILPQTAGRFHMRIGRFCHKSRGTIHRIERKGESVWHLWTTGPVLR